MGRLIPAGTGLKVYERLHETSDDASQGVKESVARRTSEQDALLGVE